MPHVTRRQALPLIAGAAILAPPLAHASVETRRTAALARGFNLPDLVPDTRSQAVDPQILRALHGRGMTHVRLPVHAEHVLPRFAGPATLAAATDDLARALNLLLGIGFAVTVDLHPGDQFARLYKTDPEAGLRAFLDGWRGLASKLTGFPSSRVFVELMNEPPTTDEIWRRHAAILVKELRPLLPSTTFITGPAPFQRVEALAAWPKLPDDNIVYAFHYYDPMPFTHQGATWMEGSPYAILEGVPFPARLGDPKIERVLATLKRAGDAPFADDFAQSLATPWTTDRIATQFAALSAWSRTNGAPVVLNEFGVLRFKAVPADRYRWLAAVRKAAEANHFGWAHWDFDTGFGMFENARLDPQTVDALLPP